MLDIPISNRRKYDIVIFGATSFTGKWLIHEILKVLNAKQKDNLETKLTWAIAGRSFKKMEQLLLHVGKETRKELLGKVDMLQADVSNVSSIVSMVQQCRIVLNCVGPYQKYGECVVKACAEFGTHHLDLSAEPMFLGQMEQKYAKMAEASGAYIIGACAFNSIPTDCGAIYLQQNFGGDVNSIESFLEFGSDNTKMSTIHSGTWGSAVWGSHYILNYLMLKEELNGKIDWPKFAHKLRFWPIQYRKDVNSWCMITPFPDGEVMGRTQRYIMQARQKDATSKPFQTRFYLQFPGIIYMMMFVLITLVYTVVAQFKFGAKLLEKYPRFFSLGMSSDEGPSVEAMNKTKFTFTLVAQGWSADSPVPSHLRKQEPPNTKKILRIRGTNPGYGATVTVFIQAALTMLKESEKMPKRGGVYSPGIAFAQTNLIERLNQNGVTFDFEK